MRVSGSEESPAQGNSHASGASTSSTQQGHPNLTSSGHSSQQSGQESRTQSTSTIPGAGGTLPKGEPDTATESALSSSKFSTGSASKETEGTSSLTHEDPNPAKIDCSLGYDAIEDEELRRLAVNTKGNQTKILSQIAGISGRYSSSHPKVTNLKGLRCATNLRDLYLQGQEVTSLLELAYLKNLRVLRVERTPIGSSDLDGIVPQLSELGLLGLTLDAKDTSLAWLSKVPGLSEVFLYGPGANNATVKEIARLVQEQRLSSVNLIKTRVTDLFPLKEAASRLKKLSLDEAPASAFHAIQNFEALTRLEIYRSAINDLAWLPNAPKLRRFYALYCPSLTTLEGIERLSGLEYFSVNESNVTNLGPLAKLTKLKELRAGDNHKLRDISALSSLRNLEELSILSGSVTDISALTPLRHLRELTIEGNSRLDDITPLESLDELEFLKAGGCSIEDVSKLSKLHKLKKLDFSGNPGLTDLDGLGTLFNLEVLSLNKCSLKDLSPLVELVTNPKSKIREIQINQNPDICSQTSFKKLQELSKNHKFANDGRVGFTLKHSCS